MGLLYKSKYPELRHFGIELNSDAAIRTESKIDFVLNVESKILVNTGIIFLLLTA